MCASRWGLSVLLAVIVLAQANAFRAVSSGLRSRLPPLSRGYSCPDLCAPSLRPRRNDAAFASLSATIACTDVDDPVAAAAVRAAKARLAARAQKLIGKPVPPTWEEGREFVAGDAAAAFGLMEVCVLRGKFARVQIGPGEDGMFRVETHAGNAETKGSTTFRSLGPTILGKLSSQQDLLAALDYYEIDL